MLMMKDFLKRLPRKKLFFIIFPMICGLIIGTIVTLSIKSAQASIEVTANTNNPPNENVSNPQPVTGTIPAVVSNNNPAPTSAPVAESQPGTNSDTPATNNADAPQPAPCN